MFSSDQIHTSIRSLIFSFAPALVLCMLHMDALMWHPWECEGLSWCVFVCLCSPILSLTLCDNRFHHAAQFSVFVCIWVCWPLYAFQSLFSEVIFKAFVQGLRSNSIKTWKYKMHTKIHTYTPTRSSHFTLDSMYNSLKHSLSCAHCVLNFTTVKLYSVMLQCFCSFWPFLNHISPLESLFIIEAIQGTNTHPHKGTGTLLPFSNAEICSSLPMCMCDGVLCTVYVAPQWNSAVRLAM